MGGLYNMVFGTNQASAAILATVGLSPADCGRFRDCWVEKTEDGSYRIAIYTRNGGGNREGYMPSPEAFPGYLFDQDDDFDCTYATVYLALPETYADDLKAIAEDKPVDMSENWQQMIAALGAEVEKSADKASRDSVGGEE